MTYPYACDSSDKKILAPFHNTTALWTFLRKPLHELWTFMKKTLHRTLKWWKILVSNWEECVRGLSDDTDRELNKNFSSCQTTNTSRHCFGYAKFSHPASKQCRIVEDISNSLHSFNENVSTLDKLYSNLKAEMIEKKQPRNVETPD